VVVPEEELQVQADRNLTREDALELLGLLRDSLSDLSLWLGGVHSLGVVGLGLGASGQTLHDLLEEMLGGILVEIEGDLVQGEDILLLQQQS